MIYDRYEAKIIKKTKVLKKLYHVRFAIIGVFTAGFLTGGTLMGTKGLVSDKVKLSGSYDYGYQYTYESSAFMSDSSYEFSTIDGQQWQDEAPTKVGKYKMRAKGNNSFNSYYYGQDQAFEIVPKVIDVTVVEDTITYGETPTLHIDDQLEFDEHLDPSYTLSIQNKTESKWTYTPNLESLKVYSPSGEDMTRCYKFNLVPKEVGILKKAITISSSSSSKVYDGTQIENKGYEITSSGLIEGDSISLVANTSFANASSEENKHTYKITNPKGEDVTCYYAITFVPGNLTISKKPISFTSENKEFIYDGESKIFSLEDVLYEKKDVAEGQKAILSYETEEEFVKAGTYSNRFSAKIVSGDVDVSANYDISYSFGVTTINKRAIKVESGSLEHTYDKIDVSKEEVTITEGSLAGKDELSFSTPSFKDVGSYENKINDFDIVDKTSKVSYLDCYDFSSKNGTIKINPYEISVEIIQKTVIYDGKPHKNEFQLKDCVALEGDTVYETYNEEKTSAGTYDNDTFKVAVKDEKENDNTDNYKINYLGREGALVINKRDIGLKLIGKEKLYDGLSIEKTMEGERYTLTSGTLAEGEYLDFKYLNGNVVDAGTYPISSSIAVYHQVGEEKDVEADIDVTNNYNISLTNADFQINKRTITIQTLDVSHEYNRETTLPKDANLFELVDGGDGLLEGHKISALNVTCEGIDVGTYPYTVDEASLVILDKDNKDVTKNYSVTLINSGTVTITARKVKVTMEPNSKIYDGKPFSSTKYTADRLLSGDYCTFLGSPSVTHVMEGDVKNEPSSVSVFTKNNEDVTSNYDITMAYKTKGIHIEPRPITIASEGLTTTFTGKPITKFEAYEIKKGTLAEGDTLEILSMVSNGDDIIHAGTYSNTFTYRITNSSDEDVTSDYDVTTEFGEITIEKVALTFDITSQNVVYDGQYHNFSYSVTNVSSSSSSIYLVSGEIPTGISMDISVSLNNLLNVGVYDDYVYDFSLSCDAGYVANNSDFMISFVSSSQTISSRGITINTIGGCKIYDGEPYGNGLDEEELYWISGAGLASGHTIEVELVQIVEVCEYALFSVKSAIIHDAFGNDVTLNYAIDYNLGEVTIYES
ncbi:MAG: hypothetical protein K6B65_05630 [Bacilli bacterium]|nr:hypothetical protein [Bacilli bacterium]